MYLVNDHVGEPENKAQSLSKYIVWFNGSLKITNFVTNKMEHFPLKKR
mgnify:FL=1